MICLLTRSAGQNVGIFKKMISNEVWHMRHLNVCDNLSIVQPISITQNFRLKRTMAKAMMLSESKEPSTEKERNLKRKNFSPFFFRRTCRFMAGMRALTLPAEMRGWKSTVGVHGWPRASWFPSPERSPQWSHDPRRGPRGFLGPPLKKTE